MNYNLLKQLKDVGFSQRSPRFYEDGKMFDEFGLSHPSVPIEIYREELEKTSYDPTTDELIEELGDDFYELRKNIDRYFASDGKSKIGYSSIEGKAKEALINLYIELHKK